MHKSQSSSPPSIKPSDIHYFHKGWKARLSDYIIFALIIALLSYIFYYSPTNKQCIPTTNTCNHPLFETMNITLNTTPLASSAPYNLEIAYPLKESTIDSFTVFYLSAIMWISVIVLSLLFYFCLETDVQQIENVENIFIINERTRLTILDIFWMLEGLLRNVCTTVALTELFITAVKNMVGRPRPWFYSNSNDAQAVLSFVSGHASVVFCTHILLVYHILSAISYANYVDGVWSNDNVHVLFGLSLWMRIRAFTNVKFVLVSMCFIFPIWVACTRVADYWHHYSDILGGALFGFLFASIGYLMFYGELYGHTDVFKGGNVDSKMEPLLKDSLYSSEKRVL